MNTHLDNRKLRIVVLVAVGVALALAWTSGWMPLRRASVPANALMVIMPYRHAGTWVFDDPNTRLVREPFVAGVPEMLDVLVRDIPGGHQRLPSAVFGSAISRLPEEADVVARGHGRQLLPDGSAHHGGLDLPGDVSVLRDRSQGVVCQSGGKEVTGGMGRGISIPIC